MRIIEQASNKNCQEIYFEYYKYIRRKILVVSKEKSKYIIHSNLSIKNINFNKF